MNPTAPEQATDPLPPPGDCRTPEALLMLAAGPPRRLGELVKDVSPSRAPLVERALELAARTGRRIGEALVETGVITATERDTLLEFQRHQRGEAPTAEKFRLGRILVEQGRITDEDLRDALARQRVSGRPLGEELVAQGRITKEDLGMALELQRKLVTGALVAMLALANPACLSSAEAAQPSSTTLSVAARVLPMVRVQMLRQPATLEITAGDIERGFVELRAATVMRVVSNTRWEVSFLSHGDFARLTQVSGLSGSLPVGPDGSSRISRSASKEPASLELGYRFELSPDARPGTYPWPVTVSANAA
jgi:hypothetical protein